MVLFFVCVLRDGVLIWIPNLSINSVSILDSSYTRVCLRSDLDLPLCGVCHKFVLGFNFVCFGLYASV